MPDTGREEWPNPREEDIIAGDRRLSRPDASLPDWEVPDSSYRPIPIVWFTGAFLSHLLTVTLIVALFARFGAWASVSLSALAAGVIGAWTWERGMRRAAVAWKAATIAILLANCLFVVVASA